LKTTIIMPSIRVPQNVDAWAKLLNPETDEIIIAGNAASPHSDILDALMGVTRTFGIDTQYVHPGDSSLNSFAINQFLPPNSTVRRNLALLVALSRRPSILLTLDDDNFPYRPSYLNGVKALLDAVPHRRPVLRSPSGWWNCGRLCEPKVVYRGYPRTHWTEIDESTVVPADVRHHRIGVVASMWYGDPDVNATERMLRDPQVVSVQNGVVLEQGTWCPFDSQSTAIHGNLMEMLFMWPDVGRYDDIWSSYVMRAVMDVTGWFITYGTPAVTQERNLHNVIRDLRDELYGYEYTEELTDLLRELVSELHDPTEVIHDSPYEVFTWMMKNVATRFTHLPEFTRDSFYAWLSDLEVLRRG